jgi:hypothetical protein
MATVPVAVIYTTGTEEHASDATIYMDLSLLICIGFVIWVFVSRKGSQEVKYLSSSSLSLALKTEHH